MASITKDNIDFLRFSAYSFKELITRKLSEDTKFTDQIYEGSNIAILIDLCAYLFQCLTYCINTAASESMFSDTQLYKNISRLVRLIGYNPKGIIPSACEFSFNANSNDDDLVIPEYTAVDTGKYDSNGKKIYYSFVNAYTISNGSGTNTVKLYNGRWKMYSNVFTSNGSNYETFVLTGLQSDSSKNAYVANGFIDVYVKRGEEFLKFKGITDEIFLNVVSTFDSSAMDKGISLIRNTDSDRYYSIRLNENKTYEIKFGNDNNGQKLQKDDQIYIFYLDTNGFEAELNIGEVEQTRFIAPHVMLGIEPETLYRDMFKYDSYNTSQILRMLGDGSIDSIINTTISTAAVAEQNVEDIRETAPNYYKLGNRLVSKSDYEYYVKNRFKDNIIDVKCHNNWDYISTFYGWLYKLGKNGIYVDYGLREADPQYYINQSKLVKYDYFFADPADENNVYLWVYMMNNAAIWKKELDEDLTAIKVLTAEMVFVDPIVVYFQICAAPVERVLEYFAEDVFDKDNESYLEITINDNALYSNAAIKMQINNIFNEYFKQTNMKLGQIVMVNEIEKQIYAINGIQRIRTVFSESKMDDDGNKIYNDRFIDGISFASWSSSLIDVGDDLNVGTINRTLEDFQFPVLYATSLIDKIKVIKKSFSNNTTVQY